MTESFQLADKAIPFSQCPQVIRGKKLLCKGEIAEVACVPKNNCITPVSAGRLGRRQTKPNITYCSFFIQEMLILKYV